MKPRIVKRERRTCRPEVRHGPNPVRQRPRNRPLWRVIGVLVVLWAVAHLHLLLMHRTWQKMALGLMAALCAWQAAAALPPAVAQALEQAGVSADHVALLVAPVNPVGGDAAPVGPRLAWRTGEPMNPASVMKLITTYAALDTLGPGWFWKTRVYVDGEVRNGTLHGNLIVQGSGDPKLVVERLQALITAIRDKGVHDIRGDILLDASVFDLPPHDPAAFDGEPLRPYNAGPSGLLVNFKALVLKFFPDAAAGTVRVESEPPLLGVSIPDHVAAARGACGDWLSKVAPNLADPSRVRLTGQYPLSCGEREWAVAWPDPDNFAPRAFAAMWRAAGGGLDGQARWSPPVPPARLLVTGYSLPLTEIIADINEYSNNVMAQQVFLTLSAAHGTPGSLAGSAETIRQWWQRRFGRLEAPIVDNGSGLTRTGRASAEALAAILQDAARGPNAGYFERSLPIAGVNGTVRHLAQRSPDSPAIGQARLKTGTLRDVSAIAGYAWGRSGRQYVVVGLINDERAVAARPALYRLVEWAVEDE